ncbi:MAG TPA: SpoIIE family protein phosphatase [Candidatus Acidoferrum sp.]|nr:SpoIIE family protein phosphatase [Candidatus Acidoferrum sp.]
MKAPPAEYGVAKVALPGQGESGDHHLVCAHHDGLLVAAIDGIGHGESAAAAARAATSFLASHADEPIITLMQLCHEELRSTRGVVLSLASIDASHGLMTWLGVGNVQGVLMRCGTSNGGGQEVLMLRGGVVGCQLPPLQAAVLPVSCGDTLVFATDGVKGEFMQSLFGLESPQRAADRILERYYTGNDDALVLVVRLTGIHP